MTQSNSIRQFNIGDQVTYRDDPDRSGVIVDLDYQRSYDTGDHYWLYTVRWDDKMIAKTFDMYHKQDQLVLYTGP